MTTITPVAELDIPSIDPSDFTLDHEALSAKMRGYADESWILNSFIGYSIVHYEDAVAILRDKRWHNASAKIPELRGITDPEIIGRRDRPSILSAEGDVHTRLRRLVAKAFAPRSADRLRPFMREVITELVDKVADKGTADIVTDITEPYPIPIICELLGAPREDWQLFSRWAEDVLRIFNGTANDELDLIKTAQRELNGYTEQMIAERRNDPREDLITDLIAAEEEGDRLDTEELVMMVNAVIVGGTDTTRNQLGCSIALLADYPDQWKLLGDDADIAPRAVEECLRYFGAIRGTGRFASEDIVYRDILFPAGTFVFPSTATSNRQESIFPDANRFDIRKEPAQQTHLTLGSGIHYCLGASLARAELQEALPILARRMPDLAIDGAVEWKPAGTAIYGPASLPVTFTATPLTRAVTSAWRERSKPTSSASLSQGRSGSDASPSLLPGVRQPRVACALLVFGRFLALLFDFAASGLFGEATAL